MKAGSHLSLWLALGVGLAASPAVVGAAHAGHEPAKVHQRHRIQFPARPLAEGVTRGKAIVMLDVDAFGELRDVLVVAYTHRDFADAVLAAVKQWRFTPGSVDGERAGSILRIVTDFQVNGVHAYSKLVGPDQHESADGDGFIYRPREIATLDRAPTALTRSAPIYPRAWIQAGRAGSVVVEFYIDEEGRPRFPEVVGEADELLGVAATLAVKEWRFESPTQGGRPVLARARQVFNFRPPATAGIGK
jgi:TonB family protein